MPQVCPSIINIENMIVASIKCQKIRIDKSKANFRYIHAAKIMFMTLMMMTFKNSDTVCQNIFAFFILLIIWSITMQSIQIFFRILYFMRYNILCHLVPTSLPSPAAIFKITQPRYA